jgi:hypothetical protein
MKLPASSYAAGPRRVTTIEGPVAGLDIVGITKWITQQKYIATGKAMTRLSSQGVWPDTIDEVTAWLGAGRTRRFRNVREFVGYTKNNPHLYSKRWVFEPDNVGNPLMVIEAATRGLAAAQQRGIALFKDPTGRWNSSFMMYMKGWDNKYRLIPPGGTPRPEAMDASSEIFIVNTSEYASSLEAHFFVNKKQEGIMYHTAKMLQRKYKALVIQFQYVQMQDIGLGTGQHKYKVPIIRIGFRLGRMKGKMTRPGRNMRRRGQTMKAGMPQNKAYNERGARYARSTRDKLGRFNQRGWLNEMYGLHNPRSRG